MDSNERNNSVSVPGSNAKDVKTEQVGECENSVAVKVNTDTGSNSIIEDKLKAIQKRKIAERYKVNMDNEDSNDSVKRMRYSKGKNYALLTNNNEGAKDAYTLLLTNSPGEWTSQEVLDFVKDECGVHISSINDSREENTDDDFQIRLRFETKKQLEQVLVKLREKEEQGKLTVNLIHNLKDESESDAESDTNVVLGQIESKQEEESTGSSKTNLDVDSEQSNDFYMREEYLKSLGIKPPITSWVNVTNFRCDKSELKEVLGLAGKVLICSVTMSDKYANVMYSHPLEAVQAVSMLNGQKYYGKTLKVEMSNMIVNKTLLPKGLVDVGPGLGKYGKPILDLPNQFKKFIKGKPSIIDAYLFQPSFLKSIGISIPEDKSYKFLRDVPTCNSHSSENETDRETSESPNEKGSDQKEQISYGPIGQKPRKKPPGLMPQIDKTVNIPPRPAMAGPMPIPNLVPGTIQGPMATPVQSSVRVPNPMPPMPIPNSMPGPMQGPMLRPNQGPMPGPRGPGPTSVGPTQRPGFPMVNQSSMYPNVPPIPGVEPVNDSRNINGIMLGPRLSGPRGPMPGPINPMLGPRGPMPGPNRFPGPGHMMGPSGPMAPNGPPRPNMYFGPNVQMFKGPDPLLVQMANLPPTTNFVGLGQKLSELGRVVFLELTTPGCANVRFASPADVDRCLQNYRQVMG